MKCFLRNTDGTAQIYLSLHGAGDSRLRLLTNILTSKVR